MSLGNLKGRGSIRRGPAMMYDPDISLTTDQSLTAFDQIQ